jgi:hypothetical protein
MWKLSGERSPPIDRYPSKRALAATSAADADDERVDDGADRPVDDEAVGHVVEGAEDGGQGGPAVA